MPTASVYAAYLEPTTRELTRVNHTGPNGWCGFNRGNALSTDVKVDLYHAQISITTDDEGFITSHDYSALRDAVRSRVANLLKPQPSVADDLFANLTAGNWGRMVADLRRWYEFHCPLYLPEETESRVATWVNAMLLRKQQLAECHDLPTTSVLFRTPEQAAEEQQKYIAGKLKDEPQIYARWVERMYRPTPAEEKVAEVVARMEKRAKVYAHDDRR